jgi:peptidoglycan LD-endopeptidase LytH
MLRRMPPPAAVRAAGFAVLPLAAVGLYAAWLGSDARAPRRAELPAAASAATGSLMEGGLQEADGFVFTASGMFVGPPAESDGPVVPVLGIEPSHLRNTFGQPRPDDRSHRGIDIAAPRGTPVMAAVDGWIVALPQGGAGGRGLFLLDRRGSHLLYYAHLDAYAPDVWAGMAVRQRELLGYVGTTGNAQQPHLHFEVGRIRTPGRLDVVPLNPYHYLTRSADR